MKHKLVCFDVDGTIIDGIDFIWTILHNRLKADIKRVENMEKKYYNREINFEEWALHDINLWKEQGATKKEIMDVIGSIKLMKGAKETLNLLKDKGIKIVVLSGGLNFALEKVLPDYKEYFDYVFINSIQFDENGKISEIHIEGVDSELKAEKLKETSEKENINLKEVVFVGDHYNDIDAAKTAGLSISFNSKSQELDKISNVVIKNKDLREILKYISS